MNAQENLFAVRVIAFLVCDISGVNAECENISYVLTGVADYVCQRAAVQAGSRKTLVVNR